MLETLNTTDVRNRVSEEEWKLRVDLAATYRLMPLFGMSDLVYNHITVRLPSAPGGKKRLLINAYGLMYEEVCASNLVTIDIDGEILFNPNRIGPDGDGGINRAGYVIHSAIHAARDDVGAVMHTHTRAGMAVAALKCGLLPLSQTALRFGTMTYHDYESVALDLDERERLVRDLGNDTAMILRSHGLLTCGPTLAETFNTMYWLEMACRAQVDAMAAVGGRMEDLLVPPQSVIDKTAHQFRPEVRRRYGLMEWPAMLRYLDRRDPSYKT
jgi:ribulose-5-phosphate 4-epimerase/fuculose-1-phosphate aldolase